MGQIESVLDSMVPFVAENVLAFIKKAPPEINLSKGIEQFRRNQVPTCFLNLLMVSPFSVFQFNQPLQDEPIINSPQAEGEFKITLSINFPFSIFVAFRISSTDGASPIPASKATSLPGSNMNVPFSTSILPLRIVFPIRLIRLAK